MAASARKAARRWRGPRSRSLPRMRGISASGVAASAAALERPGRPAAEGLRLHAPVVADVPVPLLAQVVHRAARRVAHHRPGHEAGRKARGLRPPAPVHVLGDREAGEAADRGEDRAAHREVRGGGEVVAGDGQLLAEAVDEVEGLGAVGPAGRLGEDPDRAAEDARSSGRRRRRRGSPRASRDRGCSRRRGRRGYPPAPARRRGCAPAPAPAPARRRDAPREGWRRRASGSGVEPLSTTRTSKRVGREGLLPEGVEAGGEQARLVEMRNDDADLRDRGAVDRRCPEKPSPARRSRRTRTAEDATQGRTKGLTGPAGWGQKTSQGMRVRRAAKGRALVGGRAGNPPRLRGIRHADRLRPRVALQGRSQIH